MASCEESGEKDGIRVRRKIFHLVLGTVFLLSMLLSRDLRWFFLAVLALGAVLSFLQEKRRLPVISWFLDRYDKHGDEVPGQGPLTFFLGSVVVWFIFPEKIALISLMVLTFGDPMAFMGGMLIGGPKLPWNRNKTWTGLLMFTVVPMILISFLYGPVAGSIGVITGALAETLCLPGRVLTDDNVFVPTVTALSLWILTLVVPVL
jgi:dolichol kinase